MFAPIRQRLSIAMVGEIKFCPSPPFTLPAVAAARATCNRQADDACYPDPLVPSVDPDGFIGFSEILMPAKDESQMRVFALSDIHIDYSENAKWIANLSVTEYQDDVLIVAGDVSDTQSLLDWGLALSPSASRKSCSFRGTTTCG